MDTKEKLERMLGTVMGGVNLAKDFGLEITKRGEDIIVTDGPDKYRLDLVETGPYEAEARPEPQRVEMDTKLGDGWRIAFTDGVSRRHAHTVEVSVFRVVDEKTEYWPSIPRALHFADFEGIGRWQAAHDWAERQGFIDRPTQGGV